MQKEAQIQPEPEVRSLRFQVKIKNADLLGDALSDILATRTSGKIDPYGRGFKAPNPSEYVANIYSSTIILSDQPSPPKGEYIYTMDDVVFSTEIKSDKGNEKSVDITLNGGWVLQNGEYVLVIFTRKKEIHSKATDVQKMQARTLHNAAVTRLVTQVLGRDVLVERNFSNKMLAGDYPDVNESFTVTKQKLIDELRGKKSGAPAGQDFDAQFNGGKTQQPAGADQSPKFVKDNYFLYDKQSSSAIFAYTAPGEKNPRPFDPKTDPYIAFNMTYPSFVTDENEQVQQGREPHKKVAPDSNPGYVDVIFTNIPKNMPKKILGDIFSNIYGYMKNGLEAKELQAKPNQIYSGSAVFKDDPKQTDETLYEQNAKKVKNLLAEIKRLYDDNKEYRVDFDKNMPMPQEVRGVNKNILKYLYELEVYVKNLKRNLPLSLAELDRIIREEGDSFVNPRNINLLKILKKQ